MGTGIVITLLIALGAFVIIRKAKSKKAIPVDSSIKDKPHKALKYILATIISLACGIGVIALMATQETNNKNKPDTEGLNKISAYTMAEQFVQKQLKAPTTAKFPYSNDAEINYDETTKVWTIKSYVDAQNSFGAMIRTTYTAKVKYLGDDKWGLVNIEM